MHLGTSQETKKHQGTKKLCKKFSKIRGKHIFNKEKIAIHVGTK
jgi:hypothetical protein